MFSTSKWNVSVNSLRPGDVNILVNLGIIGSGNDLAPVQYQTITWANTDRL